jgi:hypothetical protein
MMGKQYRRTAGLVLAAAATLVFWPACTPEEKEQTDVVDDRLEVEVEVEDGEEDIEVEPGNQCEENGECDDHVDCTVDTCENGYCVNTPDDGLCDDSLDCNGEEVCHVEEGCLPGEIFRGCFDGNPCTMDICVEGGPGEAPHCEYEDMDRDRDGHVDEHCPGGDDCNDMRDTVYPGARELCFDDLDNDCDGQLDFSDEECLLSNDTCETPRELELGRLEEGFSFGALGDVDSSCDGTDFPDVTYSFTLDAVSDVIVTVAGRDGLYTYAALQSECGVYAGTIHCGSGQPFQFCQKNMEAGTYYLVVSSWDEGIFDILIDVSAPGPLEEGDGCDNPIEITGDVHMEGNLLCMDDDLTLECASWAAYKDMVYTFTLDALQDVHLRVSSILFAPYVSVHETCTAPSPAVLCDSDFPFDRRLTRLDPGTYFIAVESYTAGEFAMDVRFLPPSEQPANDTCDGAVDVTGGGTFPGSLLAAGNDYSSSCMPRYLDVFYTFTLTEEQDAHIAARGVGPYTPYLVIQRVCGDVASEVKCHSYTPADIYLRSLAPGDYWIVVEGEYGGDFNLDVEFFDPTSACEGIEVIDSDRVISDTTVGRPNDFESTCGYYARSPDRPYLLRLGAESNVTAEITDGDFDTVLHIRSVCDDAGTQIACDDDGGELSLSRLDLVSLAVGDYILIVDGYGTWSSGDYTLDVQITIP